MPTLSCSPASRTSGSQLSCRLRLGSTRSALPISFFRDATCMPCTHSMEGAGGCRLFLHSHLEESALRYDRAAPGGILSRKPCGGGSETPGLISRSPLYYFRRAQDPEGPQGVVWLDHVEVAHYVQKVHLELRAVRGKTITLSGRASLHRKARQMPMLLVSMEAGQGAEALQGGQAGSQTAGH